MKSLTLVLCVIAILGAAASGFFWFQIGNTKEQLKQQVATADARGADLQGKLSESSAQAEALQKRLAALDSDLGEAKSRLTAADTRSTQLNRDLAQLRTQVTAKEEAETALNTEITQLKRELAQARLATSSASPEEIEGYKSTIATLQGRVTELEAGRSSNSGSVASSSSSSSGMSPSDTSAASTSDSAAPTPALSAPTIAAPSGLSGQVVSVGAQNGFVVLNIGSAQGVQVNQRFTISRKGAAVATASVSSVQDSYSIAQVAPDSLRSGLNKGDTAAIAQ